MKNNVELSGSYIKRLVTYSNVRKVLSSALVGSLSRPLYTVSFNFIALLISLGLSMN